MINPVLYNKRDDLKFYSSGDFESTFIEIIFPNKKNIIIGCIYCHPSSNISIQKFNKGILESVLDKIAFEDKNCALIGDFNIDLLKVDSAMKTRMPFTTMLHLTVLLPLYYNLQG